MTRPRADIEAASYAATVKPPVLHLEPGDGHIVRLISTTGLYLEDRTSNRLIGTLRGYHWSRSSGTWTDCAWFNCHLCEHGRRQHVRFETRVLLEKPDGSLEERRAFLTRSVAVKFAKIAEAIEGHRRNPTEVQILWRYKDGSTRVQEVIAISPEATREAASSASPSALL